jgi:hypothetical protein
MCGAAAAIASIGKSSFKEDNITHTKITQSPPPSREDRIKAARAKAEKMKQEALDNYNNSVIV